jgi:ABC-type glycerol-3-phosphate transport system substrate-binding protein
MSRLRLVLFWLAPVTALLAACGLGAGRFTPTVALSPVPEPTAAFTLVASATPDLGADVADVRGVRLHVWHAFYGDTATAFENQIALFNTVNAWGITVYAERQPDYRSLYEALQEVPGTERPDLMAMLPEQILILANQGELVALNPYVMDERWGLTEDALGDIPPAFWRQDEVNGQRWAVPLARSARFLFYNLTWARELGFDRPPADADEFRQQACAANAALRADEDVHNDGYGGWLVDTHWQTVYDWLLAFGGEIWQGDYQVDNAANATALTFLKGLYDDHCAWLPLEVTPPEAFARRLALFVSGDLSDIAGFERVLRQANNADEWTLLPYPGPRGGAVSTYGVSLAVLKSTPARHLAAWLFLRWLLSPERQASWVSESGLLPLRVSALVGLGRYRAAHPHWEAALAFLPDMQGTPQVASWRTVRYVLADGAQHIFRLNLPPEQIPSVLQEMQTTAQEIAGKE